MIKLLLPLISLLSVTMAGAQETPFRFPFELTADNNLSVQVLINGKDRLPLMFHLASDAVTLTEEATRNITSVRFERTDSVSAWGGAGNASRFSKNNSLRIGDRVWEQLPIWEDRYSGKGTAGKFGPHLFSRQALFIDFDNKQIAVGNSFSTAGYQRLKLMRKNGMLFIEATLHIGRKDYRHPFLLHTGYSGDLLLNDSFVVKNDFGKQLKVTKTTELKDAFGNIVKVQRATVPQFSIGTTRFNNVPVGFFEGKPGRQQMSFIGGDLLKRFHIIIDARREYIYLKPNGLQQAPFFTKG